MSALSDRDIRREMGPGGGESWRIQPASVEVTLCGEDGSLLTYDEEEMRDSETWDFPFIIDPESPPKMWRREWSYDGERRYFDLWPGIFLLACTKETVRVRSDLLAILDGKSSLARLGLQIHVSAGYLDPGWAGPVTLELVNHAPRPIRLWAGMRIGQLRFERLSSPSERPYGTESLGSHYQGSRGTVQAASVAPSGPGSPLVCEDSSLLNWGAAGAPLS